MTIPVSVLSGTAEINTDTSQESKVDAVVKDVEYKARPRACSECGSAGVRAAGRNQSRGERNCFRARERGAKVCGAAAAGAAGAKGNR